MKKRATIGCLLVLMLAMISFAPVEINSVEKKGIRTKSNIEMKWNTSNKPSQTINHKNYNSINEDFSTSASLNPDFSVVDENKVFDVDRSQKPLLRSLQQNSQLEVIRNIPFFEQGENENQDLRDLSIDDYSSPSNVFWVTSGIGAPVGNFNYYTMDYNQLNPETVSIFPWNLPVPPQGIAWDAPGDENQDSLIWIASGGYLYKINPVTQQSDIIYFNPDFQFTFTGLAYDDNDDRFWGVSEYNSNPEIFEIDKSGVIWRTIPVDTNLIPLRGIAFDGLNFWVTTNDQIFEVSRSNGNIIRQFSSPDQDTRGIEFVNNQLWIIGYQTRMIYVLGIPPPNSVPIANDDSYIATIDTTLTVDMENGVLANDYDFDDDTLTATLQANPSNGVVTTFLSDGSFSYVPDNGFTGLDSFTYTVTDGIDGVTAVVTITIELASVAVPNGDFELWSGQSLIAWESQGTIVQETNPTFVQSGVFSVNFGLSSAKITGTAIVRTPLENLIVVNPASTYTFGVWVLDNDPDGSVSLDIWQYDANGTRVAANGGPTTYSDSDSFVELILTLQTHQDAVYAQFVVVASPTSGPFSIHVDNSTITGSPTLNSPPVVMDESYTMTIGETLSVNELNGVMANDFDPDGDVLTASLLTNPSNGLIAFLSDGSFDYTPNNGFTGQDSFAYVANDGTVGTTGTVNIIVNYPPVAVANAGFELWDNGKPTNWVAFRSTQETNSEFVHEGNSALNFTSNSNSLIAKTPLNSLSRVNPASPYSFNIWVLDNDPDGTVFMDIWQYDVSGTRVAANGGPGSHIDSPAYTQLSYSLTTNPNTAFVQFIIKASFVSVDFTVYVDDVSIIGPPISNTPPISVDDHYILVEDTVLSVLPDDGLLQNDYDDEGDDLGVTLNSGPMFGTLDLSSDGSFTYDPQLNFFGQDSFTYFDYELDGNAQSSVATVTIDVNPVNDAPVAADDYYTTDEDVTLIVGAVTGVLTNDADIDLDALTASLISAPSSGTLAINSDGTFIYTPDPNFNGVDSFTYVANDGTEDSNIATVTITINPVNDAPVANDDSYTVDEDAALIIDGMTGVLTNDVDIEGDPLSVSLFSPPSIGYFITFNPDGSFTYIPGDQLFGVDSFTYVVNDGTEDSNIATVTITINPVNDPAVANDDSYTMDEDTVLFADASVGSGILTNDFDLDGVDTLTALLKDGPINGELILSTDGSFTYTPDPNFNGADSFTYVANDGTEDSNIATVTITVNPVNDDPVATDDSYTTDEDATLIVDGTGVLSNDADIDLDALTTSIISAPSSGTLVFNTDGTFTYTPNLNFNGIDSFTYVVNDGTVDSNEATVTITVNPVNDAPVANDDSYTVDEDEALITGVMTGVLTNDVDIESDPLSVGLVSAPSIGYFITFNSDGTFIYIPGDQLFGVDSFTYVVNDGTVDSNIATVTITINSVNDAPTAGDDSFTMDEDTILTTHVYNNDLDNDGDDLTMSLVSGPSNGVLTLGSGTFASFTYTPNPNFNGVDSFTYVVNDGTVDSNEATVTITVNPVNDAPVANDDSYTMDEDATLIVGGITGVLTNDADIDLDALTANLKSAPSSGTFVFNSDGSFTYTPDPNFNGVDSFTYVANDGTVDSNTVTVTITVNPVNDAPVAADDYYTTDEDVTLIVGGTGVLTNDADIDLDALTVSLKSVPSSGTLVLNSDGSFTYTPDPNFNGVDSFTYVVNDGLVDSNEVTVTITVNPVNDVPIAIDDTYEMIQDTILTVSIPGILGNDNDIEGDMLSVSLSSGTSNGVLILNTDGSFTYTPVPGFFGLDEFVYTTSDGIDTSVGATVRLIIDFLDSDNDGLSDNDETNLYGTDPFNPDTDGDQLEDGTEIIEHGTEPLIADTDGDQLKDGTEIIIYGTDPLLVDSDLDTLSDRDEILTFGTDPLIDDTDIDGLTDGDELNIHSTDPLLDDSDMDGLSDGDEVNIYGTDPLNIDTDKDGLTDGDEVTHGTDPLIKDVVDTDGDGLTDAEELFIWNTYPDLEDSDGDGLLDGEEVITYLTDPLKEDSDGDTLNDGDEVTTHGTDPALVDTDGDNLSDDAEILIHGTDPLNIDTDKDGLTDGDEVTYGTDPLIKDSIDTDTDGLYDNEEIFYGTDLNLPDSDGDGLTDGDEVNTYYTDPNLPDTDGDGLSDGDEIKPYKTDPLLADTDGDGLSDGEEIGVYSVDPTKVDTDGDGLSDYDEIFIFFTDPNDKKSK
ncbi:MAG: tandem-95 repeat protein [Candidatus Hodarchaeales archaeon]|jgi:VCBS repeat-containing protein